GHKFEPGGCSLPHKKEGRRKGDLLSPAYGHTGSRRCRTDLGGHGGASVRRHPNATILPGFRAAAGFFEKTCRRNDNAGARTPALRGSGDAGGLLPVLLDARGAQAGEAMAVDRVLPGQEFFNREGVTAARFFERQETAADGGDDFGLATDHPTLGARSREVRNGERATVGPDDILHPRAMGLGHGYSHAQD